MVSGIGEICAIGWGIFGGFVVCIGCCEKITSENSVSLSDKTASGSTSFGSTSNAKDKNGKTVTIQPYKNNYLIKD